MSPLNELFNLGIAIETGIAALLGAILLFFAWRQHAARARLERALLSLQDDNHRLESELRRALEGQARDARIEGESRLSQLQAALQAQISHSATQQTEQLKLVSQGLAHHVEGLTGTTQRGLAEVRGTLESRLQALQAGNEARLEQMRATVDERLQATLEQRLGESFRLVSERLEQVHQGLGEMQNLATGVGDLKRILGNVKTRGMFGEAQLDALLEQVLLPGQYEKNIATRPGSSERVEFAVRLPGQGDGTPVWLPIDAKFPSEDYDRLQIAQDLGDPVAVEEAAKALEARIRLDARMIREKYVEPPHTTDFAILFLPTESLFAEVLRRPGLIDSLHRERRIVIAGPSTLYAMLNTLQMGFRTLAIEARSAEVWRLLGAVKTEFKRFGEWLARVRDQVRTVSNTLESADTRTRQMDRALRQVEALPDDLAARMLPAAGDELAQAPGELPPPTPPPTMEPLP
jgi:DNA recombination protein RmuC